MADHSRSIGGIVSTKTGITLWNIYLFFARIPLCFEVGVIWL